jgi:DNA-binding transcriptional regulator LsrR (DeoR family)
MTTTLAWVAVILLFPLILLLWATESQQQRIRRLHTAGLSQTKIATRLNLSRYTVRKALMTT